MDVESWTNTLGAIRLKNAGAIRLKNVLITLSKVNITLDAETYT